MNGVAPRPDTSTATSSPRPNGRSSTIRSTIIAAISAAGRVGSTAMPGSPWWPMPTSISPSLMVKFGLPAAGIVQADRPMPMERVWSMAFCAAAITSSRLAPSSARAPPAFHIMISPATPRRRSRSCGPAEATSSLATTVLDLDAVLGRQLDRHLHVHVVAGVVAIQAGDALPAIGRAERGVEALGGRRGEHLADGHGVEQAWADVAQKGRLVPGAAAGDDADPASRAWASPAKDARVRGGCQQVRMGGQEAAEAVLNDLVGMSDDAVQAVAPKARTARRPTVPHLLLRPRLPITRLLPLVAWPPCAGCFQGERHPDVHECQASEGVCSRFEQLIRHRVARDPYTL